MQYETYTVANLEVLISRHLGDFISSTASGGAAGGTTLTSTALLTKAGASYVNRYIRIDSSAGNANGNIRQINTSAVASGILTITPYNVFSAQIASGDTFSIHQLDPTWKIEAIDETLRGFTSYAPLTFAEYLIVGECLRNRSFEWWRSSTAPYDWTTVAGTIAKETSTIYDGKASLKVSTASATIEQQLPLERFLDGVTLTFTAWVQGDGTDGARIRLSQGSTNGNSPTVGTSTAWQQLTATLAIADRYQPIYARLLTGNTVTTYFDNCRVYIPTTNRCTWLPYSDYYKQLYKVEVGPRSDITTDIAEDFDRHDMPNFYGDGYAWFTGERGKVYPYPELINQGGSGVLPNPYWMRLLGEGRHPTVTASTDTVEMTEEAASLLAAKAALRVLHKAKGAEHFADKGHWDALERDILGVIAEIQPRLSVARPSKRLW